MAIRPAATLPKGVVNQIKRTWPRGVVDEFDTSESYFCEIQDKVRRDFQRIRDLATFWETPDPDSRYARDWDDDEFGAGEDPEDFQSYRVYFLSPKGEEFTTPDESESYEDPDTDDPDALETEEITVSGERTEGYAVGISLVAPVAAVCWSGMAHYEDGSFSNPDISLPGLGETYEGPDELPESQETLRKMERLRKAIAAVLEKHKIRLLDEAILGMPVAGLRAGKEVFIDKPVRVFDAFFFRGV
jgi:hypothetical protein